MKTRSFVISILAVASATLIAQEEFLLFNSGFEPGVTGTPVDALNEFSGIDLSVPPPNDWDAFEDHPMIGNINLQYQGGVVSERFSKIIEEPGNPDNHVLQFWLQDPNVVTSGCEQCKGRIQLNIYNNNGFYEMRQTNRMYLHEDWDLLQQLEHGFNWMTLSEFWNEGNWYGDEHPFRISVNLIKEEGVGRPYHFGIHGQTGAIDGSSWTSIWAEENTEFEVPVGKWMTFEYVFFEGDKDNGNLVFRVTVEGEEPVTIFDIHDYTRHPQDPNPDGLTLFNPLKMYTSASTLNEAKNIGVALQIYWDDLAVFAKEYEKIDTLGSLNAGVVENNQVLFTWEDMAESEEGYRILRKDPQENIYYKFAEVGPDVTSYTTSPGEILPYQTFTYTLTAFQGAATYSGDNEILFVLKDTNPPDNYNLEAEDFEAVAPWESVNDSSASNDKYLHGTKNSPFARLSPPNDGHLQYGFTVNKVGDFQVQLRSRIENAGNDSFWVRMDEGDWTKFEMGEPFGPDWTWRTVSNPEGDVVLYSLEPGNHTLTITYREGYTPLDAIVVTSNTAYFPAHPIMEFFGDPATLNNKIWNSGWWGIFESNALLFPYLRHEKYAWIYCEGISAYNGFWFWGLSGAMGWNYTSTLLHPYLFNLNRGEWLYAYQGMNNYYYSYANNEVVQIGEVLNPYTADLIKEAEEGQHFGSFIIGENPQASGGKFVHVPNGGNTGTITDDSVRMTFTIEESGTYQIKAWVLALAGEDNSFFVTVNNQPAGGYLYDTPIGELFVEDYVNDRDKQDPVELQLNPGEVVVEFLLREDGGQLDKVELEKQ